MADTRTVGGLTIHFLGNAATIQQNTTDFDALYNGSSSFRADVT